MNKNVIVVGGGTGGHLSPAIAISEILQSNNYQPHLVTDKRCEKFVPANLAFDFTILEVSRLNFSPAKLIASLKENYRAFVKSYHLIKNLKPEMIVGCGGYTAIPLLILAIFLKVKFVLHEQNAVVGRTNYWFSRFAQNLFISFMHTINLPLIDSNKIIWTGNPVVQKIRAIDSDIQKKDSNFTLLITGGSQGAEVLDQVVPSAIEQLQIAQPDLKFEVIQQVKSKNLKALKEFYESKNIACELAPFFSDIEQKYLCADLIIARAGASTITEIINCQLPSILIPYPSAKDNHQLYNAMNLVEYEAAILLDQKNLTPVKLSEILKKLVKNSEQLVKMAARVKELQVNSAEIIAAQLHKIIDKK